MKRNIFIAFAAVFILAGCKKDDQQPVATIVFSASGDISNKLNEFRSQLGNLNTTTGMTVGRREINWEGVPDSIMGLRMPNDFFNPTVPGSPVARQRGLVYIGGDNAVVSKTNFADINALAASEFGAFSGTKTFAVTNALLWPVNFRVAGTNTDAVVMGFGIVFSDVDKANSTFIEFFFEERSLGKFFVPPHDNTTNFSFLGVYFPVEKVTHVKVGHDGKLSDGGKDISQGGTSDLVILDDFIYSEPVAK
jgi:hypothetical protein